MLCLIALSSPLAQNLATSLQNTLSSAASCGLSVIPFNATWDSHICLQHSDFPYNQQTARSCLGFQMKISNHLSGLECHICHGKWTPTNPLLGLQPGTESRFTKGRAWEEWVIIHSLLLPLPTQELEATSRRQCEPGSEQLKCGDASHRHSVPLEKNGASWRGSCI